MECCRASIQFPHTPAPLAAVPQAPHPRDRAPQADAVAARRSPSPAPGSRRLWPVAAAAAAALLAIASFAGAQAYVPEDNLAYPVQVVIPGDGGTGFFVRRNQEIFLVTARHVLFDVATGQLQREFTLRAPSKNVKEAAVTVIHVNA